jgi:glycogen operon protein
MLVNGDATDELDERGRPIKGDTMLLVVNGGDRDVKFTLPRLAIEGQWAELLDTSHAEQRVLKTDWICAAAHGVVLLRYGTERRTAVEVPEPVVSNEWPAY